MSIALLQNVGKEVVDGYNVGPDDWEERVSNLHDFECFGWRCVAHTMQLAVLDVLKGKPHAVSDAIKVVRDISIHTKRSASMMEKLRSVQKREWSFCKSAFD